VKAVFLREIGGPQKLSYEEIDKPVPQSDEVLVRMKYAALNRRDLWITYGLYPGMTLPTILGSDGAGEVIDIGKEVTNVNIGDLVIINPALHWGANPHYYSSNFSILGMPKAGTFADYTLVPSEQIFLKPEHLSLETAAAMPLGGVTAYRALFTRGHLQPSDTVFIPGIGSGVALFALQMALAHGAKVFVSSSNDQKLALAKKLGASGGVNYRSEDWVKQLKQLMGGADLIIDCVGGSQFNHLLHIAKPGGRIVNFGTTGGPVPELQLPKLFFKHIDIRGTTMGSPQDFQNMLQFISQHQIHPVIDRSYPITEIKEALTYMEKGGNFGKITIKITND
jgi:NADPH:quinone reductase-like Zn-dependent oxidoreductase